MCWKKLGEFLGVEKYDEDERESEPVADEVAENDYAQPEREPERKKKKGDRDMDSKIMPLKTTTQLEVVLVKPTEYNDASGIADQLVNKRTVVLNLESTEQNISRRLLDFLSGVAYATNGQIKRVANATFIITPYNVGFVGDIMDEIENSGVFFYG